MIMLKRILKELGEHAPFTAAGAVTGIVLLVIIQLCSIPRDISEALFYTLHPLHVIFSALATTGLYRIYNKRARWWMTIIIGYTGSVGIATLSDAIIPYLEGSALSLGMEFHLPFMESGIIPYLGIPEWAAVNGAAIIGIAFACWKPSSKLPHLGHILISTWASLFSFTAFTSTENWMPLLPVIFIFLFIAVWLPCCVSDIVYPMLWVKTK